MKVVCRYAGAAAALLFASASTQALPLDPATCDGAAFEQNQMADVPPVLERGAVWGKANASPATLQRVAHWIELQEILSFRCGRARVTPEAMRAAAAADLIENPPPPPTPVLTEKPVGATAPPGPAAISEPNLQPKPKAKPKSKPKPSAAGGPDAPTAAEPSSSSDIEVMPEAAKDKPIKKQRSKPPQVSQTADDSRH